MSSERVDWVEIIEPKTKEHMYANLTTGECVWDPPEGVNVKRTDSSQWWELFDNNTHRFYYYNATTQTTVWRRPIGCDIIPLAKLQTLKQNTDPQQRREISTQTAQPGPQVTNKVNITNGILNVPGNAVSPCNAVIKIASQTQTSPIHSRRAHHHRCSDSRRGRGSADSGLISSTTTNAASAVALRRHTDSGRSSDSSISSAQQKRLQSQDSAVGCSVKASGTDSVTSSSSSQVRKRVGTNANAAPSAETEKWTHQANLNHSGSASFMSPRKDASDDSMHEKYFKSVESTPLSRRKLKHGGISSGDSASPVSPASPISPQPRIQLQQSSRSAFVSGVSPGAESQQSHHSQQSHRGIAIPQAPVIAPPHAQHSLDRHHHQPSYLDRNARERFSDRQLESSIASRGIWGAGAVGATAGGRANRPASLERRSGQTREITKRQQAEPEKLTLTKQHTTATPEIREPREKPPAVQHQISDTAVSGYGLKTLSLEPHLTKPNLERHNKEMERERESKRPKDREGRSSRRRDRTYKKMVHSLESPEASGPAEDADEDEDDGNISPLYSNWELRGLQHLLPLQNYILQQASMAEEHHARGGRRREHRLDSDSWSGSAGSLSGHEPDNEDSDAAPDDDDDDFDGTYLTHRTTAAAPATAIPATIPQVPPLSTLPHRPDLYDEQEYMNHGVSYYNTFVGYERENLHPTGIQRTQSAGGVSGGGLSTAGVTPTAPALYSPVRTHPVPPSQQLSIPALVGVPAHEQDIEKFAQDNLNLKSKGIFRKKASVRDMLSWTGSSLTAPMLGVRWERSRRRAAIEMFRLVQVYMGDRKARPGMTLNSVARDVLHSVYDDDTLRDELYVQLCRQTTENPQRDSLLRGWELMAVCLAFVPPSATFQPALINYVNRHRDPTFADAMFTEIVKWPIHVQVSHYAGVACRRLERIGHSGNRQPKKPNTDDIDQARIQIFRTSMFGNTLAEVMALQKDRFPNRQLPWIQTTLSNQILALQGLSTEGIFRVSADVDEVLTLKGRIDAWEEIGSVNGDSEGDAHAPASLLKLWYRELYEPLIPALLYADCVEAGSLDDASAALRCVRRMPRLNRRVLTYLIAFLQRFAAADIARTTKMDAANLATVFAPNCLRCPSRDPRVILENARREMAFVRCLILHMDTAGSLDVL